MVGQRRRLVQGVWDHHQVRFTQWQSPFEEGPWSSQQQQPPLVGTVFGRGSWSFIMEKGGVCGRKTARQTCPPVEAEWGEKNEERRSTKRSMDQTFERGVVMLPCRAWWEA